MAETTTTDLGLPGFSQGSLAPGLYATSTFRVPFTLEVGEGWFAARPESPTGVSLALTDRPDRLLDVPYVDFVLSRPDSTIEETSAEVDQTGIEVLSTEPITIGGAEGIRVTARMDGVFAINVLSTPARGIGPANEPAMMRFDILDVDGTTLIIFVEALPEEFDAFVAEFADPVLATIEFR